MFELTLLLFFLLIICQIVYTSIKIGISPMPSSLKACNIMFDLSKKSKSKTIIDVGSGFGFLALFFAFKNPNVKIIGYETSLFPWMISVVAKYICRRENLNFYRKNFLTIEFPSDCLIICYLFPQGMFTLEDKLKHRDIMVISNTFSFNKQKPKETKKVNDLYKTPIYVY